MENILSMFRDDLLFVKKTQKEDIDNVKAEIDSVRDSLKADVDGIRDSLKSDVDEIKTAIHGLALGQTAIKTALEFRKEDKNRSVVYSNRS